MQKNRLKKVLLSGSFHNDKMRQKYLYSVAFAFFLTPISHGMPAYTEVRDTYSKVGDIL
ncbi:MAG: hypothetical protein WCI23_02785 [Chlorobiaceae bacterium]|jgi:hypothetical protein